MINKKEFDLLLNQIIQIESKIEEIKILNKFDEAKDYETQLEIIKLEAKDIELDSKNSSKGFDDISSKIFNKLLVLDSEIEYYVLKTNNTIENAIENEFDPEAIEKVRILWDSLEKDISIWKKDKHNPIEELEFKKHIGKMTLDNIIYQLQVEAIIDFTKVFKYCDKEYLLNAIKENLYEGAKNEFGNDIKRNLLINKAKTIVEEDIYDYKLWQEILRIRNIRSRENHIEMLGSLRDIDSRKFKLEDDLPKGRMNPSESNYSNSSDSNNDTKLDLFENDSIINSIKNWFYDFKDNTNQRKMQLKWGTHKGPAFKYELINEDIRYSEKHLDNNAIENSKVLYIASNGLAIYNLDKNSNWNNLEKLSFLSEKNTSLESLSPDKTYNCIGNDTFANCPKLNDISFGKIEIIGNNAFENCISLKELVFPKDLMNIGEDAFKGCTNLNKVTFLGDLKLYILQRPQNVINCFRDTNLEEIVFANIEAAFNFAIADCPKLKTISVSNIPEIKLPFKTCKYKLGRQEGIVSFVGENALNLWKKRNSNVKFYELSK